MEIDKLLEFIEEVSGGEVGMGLTFNEKFFRYHLLQLIKIFVTSNGSITSDIYVRSQLMFRAAHSDTICCWDSCKEEMDGQCLCSSCNKGYKEGYVWEDYGKNYDLTPEEKLEKIEDHKKTQTFIKDSAVSLWKIIMSDLEEAINKLDKI